MGIEEAASQWGHAAACATSAVWEVVASWTAPHVVMRPRVYRDGDSWCALYGENIMEGVCGFGSTPAEACAAFDAAWREEAA